MKTKLLIIAGLIGVCCLISCKKEDINHGNSNVDGDKTEDTLPELEDVDDVCTKMDDINFMKYCYDNFDVNNDGKVSMPEAKAVRYIGGDKLSPTVVSFVGIEYFSNLEQFSLSNYINGEFVSQAVETIDLRYNKHLISISIPDAHNISSLDLRHNIELKYIYMGGCSKLKSIYLPQSMESLTELAFNKCYELTMVDMSQCINLKELVGHGHAPISDVYTFSSEVLKEFSIGAITPPDLSGCVFHRGSGILYVPAESIDAYKNSDWGNYFSQIVPIEK